MTYDFARLGKRLLLATASVPLFLSLTATAAQAAPIKVCSSFGYGDLTTANWPTTRSVLQNTSNFGPDKPWGDYQFTFQSVFTSQIDTSTCDIYFNGFIPENPALTTALQSFSSNGGFVIGGCDNQFNDGVCRAMGRPLVTTNSTTAVAYNSISPADNPLACDGTGSTDLGLSLLTAGGIQGTFGPTSDVVLATFTTAPDVGENVLITDSLTTPTFILSGDVNMYGANSTINGGVVDNDQEKFLAGVFKFAADNSPSGAGNTGSSGCALPSSASLALTKVADNDTDRQIGDVITYTYTVTNDGSEIVNDVTITDTHNGSDPAPTPGNETLLTDVAPLGDSTDAAQNGSWDALGVGDSITFTGTYTVTVTDVENL